PPAGQTECSGSGCTAAPGSVAGLGAFNVFSFDAGQWTPHTISADGSRIVFTAAPFTLPGSIDNTITVVGRAGDLYMRIDGSRTLKLNVSERPDCAAHDPCGHTPEPDPAGPQPAMYGGASRDDSKVFFTTKEQLTDDANTGDLKLYRYDTAA